MREGRTDDHKSTGMCVHGNFPSRCPVCVAETEKKVTFTEALELLGKENVFGAERVREVFGINLDGVPDIPFSREELERAKENGERLVLRVDRFDAQTPFTIQELVKRLHQKGERLFSETSDVPDELDWVEGMQFQNRSTPKTEWRLIMTKPMHGVRNLSFEAQNAFMEADAEKLRVAIDDMNRYWDELLTDPNNQWLREDIERARESLPTIENFMEVRKYLPETGTLPTVIEAIYDAKMLGGAPFDNMSVVTADTVEAFEDEPERPIDISFLSDGVSLHIRRDKRFGRPHKLGSGDGFIEGIPIGYVQH